MEQKIKKLLENKKVIGIRQVVRGISDKQIRCVLLATNTDEDIKREIVNLCKTNNVPILFTPSKEELGKEVGIDVNCATVGLLE